MKIAFVSAWTSRTGAGVFAAESQLANALARNGVRMFKFGPCDALTEEDRRKWVDVDVRPMRVRGPYVFRYMPGLVDALVDVHPDLIHAHGIWTYATIGARLAAQRMGVPFVISPHGMLDRTRLSHKSWKKAPALVTYEGSNFRAAAQFHALTDAERQCVEALGYPGRTRVIPNGINIPELSDRRDKDRFVILYVGRINVLKGLDLLIEAWARLLRKSDHAQSWELRIVGYGDPPDYAGLVCKQVERLGLSDCVKLVGAKYGSELEQEYRNADVAVLPSKTEGLPMSILEAWSYGLPAIYTTECNLPVGMEAGAAQIVEPTVEDLYRGLHHLSQLSRDEFANMQIAARRLAEREFTWPTIAEQFLKLYEAVQTPQIVVQAH